MTTKYTCRNCKGKQSSKHIKAMLKAGFGLCHLACKHCGEQTIAIQI